MYRKYDKRTKLAVVMAAEMSGLSVTADETGIPKTTIAYWMDQPEFVQIRTKTREDLADEIKVVAHLAWQRTAEALRDGTIEPRDILFAAEKATGLQLLMSGEPTSRNELRDITKEFDDHELDLLRSAIEREDSDRTTEEAAVVGDSSEGSAPA